MTRMLWVAGDDGSRGGSDSGTLTVKDGTEARRGTVVATEMQMVFGTYSISEMSTSNLREFGSVAYSLVDCQDNKACVFLRLYSLYFVSLCEFLYKLLFVFMPFFPSFLPCSCLPR